MVLGTQPTKASGNPRPRHVGSRPGRAFGRPCESGRFTCNRGAAQAWRPADAVGDVEVFAQGRGRSTRRALTSQPRQRPHRPRAPAVDHAATRLWGAAVHVCSRVGEVGGLSRPARRPPEVGSSCVLRNQANALRVVARPPRSGRPNHVARRDRAPVGCAGRPTGRPRTGIRGPVRHGSGCKGG